MQFSIEREIAAPIEKVFAAATDFENVHRYIPDIVKSEYVSEAKSGVGARFRETRKMHGKEATVEMEVVAWEEPALVSLFSHAMGTDYLSTFRFVAKDAGNTRVVFDMKSTPKGLLAKGMDAMMGGMMKKEIANDIEKLAAFVEAKE